MNAVASATVNGVQLRSTIVCGPWVTFAPHGPTYTTSELAAIKTFTVQSAAGIFGASDNINGYAADGSNPPPPTLLDIPGFHTCAGTYEVTNVGNSLVQINGAGYQPTQAPAAFTYDYRLLDACPFLQGSNFPGCACGGCGAAYGCAYSIDIQMTMSQSAAMQNFAPNSDPDCPTPLTLQPGQTQPILVKFEKPTGGGAVWFRGAPALSVTTASGTVNVPFPSLLDNLVFVDIGDHTSSGQPTPNPYGPAPQDANVKVECYTQAQGGAFKLVPTFLTSLNYGVGQSGSQSLCY